MASQPLSIMSSQPLAPVPQQQQRAQPAGPLGIVSSKPLPASSDAPTSQSGDPSVWSQVKEAGSEIMGAPKRFMDWATGTDPIGEATEAGKGITAARQAHWKQATDAYQSGDYKSAAEHALFAVPFVGPAMGQAGEEAKTKPVLAGIHMAETMAPFVSGPTSLLPEVDTSGIVSTAQRYGRAISAATKAAAPDVASGALKIGAGEVVGKIPGMEWPGRIGLGYPGARQAAKGITKGIQAAKDVLSPAIEAAPSEDMTMLDGIAKGQGIRGGFSKATAEQQASIRDLANRIKASESGSTPTPPPAVNTPSASAQSAPEPPPVSQTPTASEKEVATTPPAEPPAQGPGMPPPPFPNEFNVQGWLGDAPPDSTLSLQKAAQIRGSHIDTKNAAVVQNAIDNGVQSSDAIRKMTPQQIKDLVKSTKNPISGKSYTEPQEVLSKGKEGRTLSQIQAELAAEFDRQVGVGMGGQQ